MTGNMLSNTARCRFCGTELHHTFVDLGMAPPCNEMVKPSQVNEIEAFFPQPVYVCDQCFLVQLEEYVSAAKIFNNDYTYFSSYSDTMLQHARRYVHMITERLGLNKDSQVIELASNDGYLLQYFVELGIPVLGVEPSGNTAEVAMKKGIPSIVKFFGHQTAHELAAQGQFADPIIGNNLLAHVPNINDFVSSMKVVLKPQGVITMEFPHLLRLMAENQFDTIYHEHFSYLSFLTVGRIFAAHGL